MSNGAHYGEMTLRVCDVENVVEYTFGQNL